MKKKFLNVLAVALFLIGTVGYANADLVEEDLFTVGDGLITYDTDTGLYWLDLTLTTNLSYNDVLNEISQGGALEGFWYATTADIDTLQVSAGLPSGLFFSTFPIYVNNMNQLLYLVGITDPPSVLSGGITSEPFEPTTTIDDRIDRYFTARVAAEAAQGVIGDNIASSMIGSWLITDTLPNLSEPDIDNDGIPDFFDNCIDTPNPYQVDSDVDGVGDLCDVCIDIPDDQTDSDDDGLGDVCDECPTDPDKIIPGACGCGTSDTDSDSDGIADCNDQCPLDANKLDPGECGCGTPDLDSDNDGTLDCNDECPNDSNKIAPGECGCGTPDTDSDSDGTADCIDACPFDGLNDADNDNICGDVDNCPDTANTDQLDFDSDGIGDVCDPDADNDGFSGDDCNDLDDTINPAAAEIPYNGIDENCNGMTDDDDLDADGYGTAEDCNEGDASIYPDAVEVKHDGIDQNCNGYDLTIDIIQSDYKPVTDTLEVEATSSLGASANLEVMGLGSMIWKSNKQKWLLIIKKVGGDPGLVTVSGIEGQETSITY